LGYSRHTQNKQQQIMRTKTLLLAAAVIAAGLTAATAQSVYSVNAVGYVNLSLGSGFTMIGNPLNTTNANALDSVLPAPPDGTQILKWDSANQRFFPAHQFFDGAGWIPGGNLSPGEGAFINLENPTTITFVGEVPQGALSNNIPLNFSAISMQTPQAINLTDAGFPADDGDQILTWNPALQRYNPAIQYFDGAGWIPGDPNGPTPAVGQGFFVNKAVERPWTRTFSVN
jgi:hypothetical protein